MLRTSGLKVLGPGDVGAARRLCDRDPVANVFVAARLDEGGSSFTGSPLGLPDRDGGLASFVWAAANVVPVGVQPDDYARYAARLKRGRRRFSSVFGPADAALGIWQHLGRGRMSPMSFRPEQPLMAVAPGQAHRRTCEPDLQVRLARREDLDEVVPAAARMFTEEIGYAPYVGSDAAYRASVARLIEKGRTFVMHDERGLVFKADVGSMASGVAQVQGVWVDPRRRGEGLAAPCMARVVELVQQNLAPTVSLYVNDYNVPALRAYEWAGFQRVGTFATVIL